MVYDRKFSSSYLTSLGSGSRPGVGGPSPSHPTTSPSWKQQHPSPSAPHVYSHSMSHDYSAGRPAGGQGRVEISHASNMSSHHYSSPPSSHHQHPHHYGHSSSRPSSSTYGYDHANPSPYTNSLPHHPSVSSPPPHRRYEYEEFKLSAEPSQQHPHSHPHLSPQSPHPSSALVPQQQQQQQQHPAVTQPTELVQSAPATSVQVIPKNFSEDSDMSYDSKTFAGTLRSRRKDANALPSIDTGTGIGDRVGGVGGQPEQIPMNGAPNYARDKLHSSNISLSTEDLNYMIENEMEYQSKTSLSPNNNNKNNKYGYHSPQRSPQDVIDATSPNNPGSPFRQTTLQQDQESVGLSVINEMLADDYNYGTTTSPRRNNDANYNVPNVSYSSPRNNGRESRDAYYDQSPQSELRHTNPHHSTRSLDYSSSPQNRMVPTIPSDRFVGEKMMVPVPTTDRYDESIHQQSSAHLPVTTPKGMGISPIRPSRRDIVDSNNGTPSGPSSASPRLMMDASSGVSGRGATPRRLRNQQYHGEEEEYETDADKTPKTPYRRAIMDEGDAVHRSQNSGEQRMVVSQRSGKNSTNNPSSFSSRRQERKERLERGRTHGYSEFSSKFSEVVADSSRSNDSALVDSVADSRQEDDANNNHIYDQDRVDDDNKIDESKLERDEDGIINHRKSKKINGYIRSTSAENKEETSDVTEKDRKLLDASIFTRNENDSAITPEEEEKMLLSFDLVKHGNKIMLKSRAKNLDAKDEGKKSSSGKDQEKNKGRSSDGVDDIPSKIRDNENHNFSPMTSEESISAKDSEVTENDVKNLSVNSDRNHRDEEKLNTGSEAAKSSKSPEEVEVEEVNQFERIGTTEKTPDNNISSIKSKWHNDDVILIPRGNIQCKAAITVVAAALLIVDEERGSDSFEAAVKGVSNILSSKHLRDSSSSSSGNKKNKLHEPASLQKVQNSMRLYLTEKESQKPGKVYLMTKIDFYARCAMLSACAIIKAGPKLRERLSYLASETILTQDTENDYTDAWLVNADSSLQTVASSVHQSISLFSTSTSTSSIASLASIAILSEGGKCLALERIRRKVRQSRETESRTMKVDDSTFSPQTERFDSIYSPPPSTKSYSAAIFSSPDKKNDHMSDSIEVPIQDSTISRDGKTDLESDPVFSSPEKSRSAAMVESPFPVRTGKIDDEVKSELSGAFVFSPSPQKNREVKSVKIDEGSTYSSAQQNNVRSPDYAMKSELILPKNSELELGSPLTKKNAGEVDSAVLSNRERTGMKNAFSPINAITTRGDIVSRDDKDRESIARANKIKGRNMLTNDYRSPSPAVPDRTRSLFDEESVETEDRSLITNERVKHNTELKKDNQNRSTFMSEVVKSPASAGSNLVSELDKLVLRSMSKDLNQNEIPATNETERFGGASSQDPITDDPLRKHNMTKRNKLNEQQGMIAERIRRIQMRAASAKTKQSPDHLSRQLITDVRVGGRSDDEEQVLQDVVVDDSNEFSLEKKNRDNRSHVQIDDDNEHTAQKREQNMPFVMVETPDGSMTLSKDLDTSSKISNEEETLMSTLTDDMEEAERMMRMRARRKMMDDAIAKQKAEEEGGIQKVINSFFFPTDNEQTVDSTGFGGIFSFLSGLQNTQQDVNADEKVGTSNGNTDKRQSSSSRGISTRSSSNQKKRSMNSTNLHKIDASSLNTDEDQNKGAVYATPFSSPPKREREFISDNANTANTIPLSPPIPTKAFSIDKDTPVTPKPTSNSSPMNSPTTSGENTATELVVEGAYNLNSSPITPKERLLETVMMNPLTDDEKVGKNSHKERLLDTVTMNPSKDDDEAIGKDPPKRVALDSGDDDDKKSASSAEGSSPRHILSKESQDIISDLESTKHIMVPKAKSFSSAHGSVTTQKINNRRKSSKKGNEDNNSKIAEEKSNLSPARLPKIDKRPTSNSDSYVSQQHRIPPAPTDTSNSPTPKKRNRFRSRSRSNTKGKRAESNSSKRSEKSEGSQKSKKFGSKIKRMLTPK